MAGSFGVGWTSSLSPKACYCFTFSAQKRGIRVQGFRAQKGLGFKFGFRVQGFRGGHQRVHQLVTAEA